MASLSMKRGDTEVFDLDVNKANGDAQPLTSCTLWMTAKYKRSDPDADAVFQLTNGSGIEITDAAGGLAVVTISPSDTSGLGWQRLLEYDIQLKDASGKIYTIDSGTLAVTMDATVTTT